MNRHAASAGRVSLFSALAVQPALDKVILPAYRAATGAEIDAVFDPTTVLVQRVVEGARPDVVIATRESFDRMAEVGAVDLDTRAPVARAGIGVAIAGGAMSPDINTVDSLVATLLAARSVAYSRTGASGIYFARLIERLGIAEAVNVKATIIEKGYTARAVADGRADIAVQQVSELAFVPGVRVVGPLPAPIQHYTGFDALLGSRSRANGAARALMATLLSPQARDAYTRAGLDPA